MSQFNKFSALLAAAALGLAVSATASNSSDDIAARIAPAGELCMAGDDCAAAPAAPAAAEPRTGKQLYDTKCAACHATGAAGAPKYGTADWTPRIAKGIDTLYTHALNGFNAMPAKGTCFDCSDDEIKGAVDFMVEGSK